MPVLESRIVPQSTAFQQNRTALLAQIDYLRELEQRSRANSA